MIDLTDLDEIKALDPKDVYGSTGMFVSQCKQILEDAKKIVKPETFINIENVILCGMGGSAYGGYVAQTLFKDSMRLPVYSNNDYHLPAFANEKSLIILSSYSGSTEESLSCGEEAKTKNLKIAGITTGGKLGVFLKTNMYPSLIFDPKFNPSGQPRLGTGYMVLGFFALLNRLSLLKLAEKDVTNAIIEVETLLEDIKVHAMDLSKQLMGFIPVIFSSEFLGGNAHIMRNQFNETSKSFSAFEDIPELNHHLMEGFKYPQGHKLKVFFLHSELYSDKYKKRFKLTKDVVEKNSVELVQYHAKGPSKLSQSLEVLAFGGYLSLYLALLYGQDPSLIPWVDYFKENLNK